MVKIKDSGLYFEVPDDEALDAENILKNAGNRFDLQPKKPRPYPLKSDLKIKEENKEIIEKTERDLDQIAPALVELCKEAKKEKPDNLIFLDKSCRIFAGPIKKFIRDILAGKKDYSPNFLFFNDDEFKNSIVRRNEENKFEAIVDDGTKKKIDDIFKEIKGEKTFIIDETFSFAKGVRAFVEAVRYYNQGKKQDEKVEILYFSLAYNEKPVEIYPASIILSESQRPAENGNEFFIETLDMAKSTDGFKLHIYNNNIPDLFSTNYKLKYVRDRNDQSESINTSLNDFKKEEDKSKYDDLLRLYGSNWDEQVKQENNQIFYLSKVAKKMIYEKMIDIYEKK
jgi:hypothetical protein